MSRSVVYYMFLFISFFGLTIEPSASNDSEKKLLRSLTTELRGKFLDADGKERRYVGQVCQKPDVASSSGKLKTILAPYEQLPVQDCTSKTDGRNPLIARALVILPPADKVAVWIMKACTGAEQKGEKLKSCLNWLTEYAYGSNQFQFIVSGVIREPKCNGYTGGCDPRRAGNRDEWSVPECVKSKDEEVLYSFRDGVTVVLEGKDRASWRKSKEDKCAALNQPTSQELESFLTATVKKEPGSVKNYGRIACTKMIIT